MTGPRSDSKLIPAFSAAAPDSRPRPLETEVVDLFDQLREPLLRYLLTFGLPVADCEEVLQETFLALFEHLQRGKSRHNLRGWLFRVAHNLALKKRQQSRRSSTRQAELANEHPVVDPAPSPEDQLANTEHRTRLLAVLRALPEQDRRCLSLRAEGLRYREIAKVLDMSLGAVALSLGRSMARMARAIER